MIDRQELVEGDPYPRQVMPRFWRWHMTMLHVVTVVFFVLFFWKESWWYLVTALIFAGFLSLDMHRLVRCPQCSRRLQSRLVEEPGQLNHWRYLYDCPGCQVTWDSNYVDEPGPG